MGRPPRGLSHRSSRQKLLAPAAKKLSLHRFAFFARMSALPATTIATSPPSPPPVHIISLRNAGVCYHPLRTLFSKTKKEIWALRGLNLDIYEGEKLGVIGRNGSGKSTLMRVLTGIYGLDEGTITRHKKDTHVELLSLGVGFEGTLTGRENAVLNGMLMGKSRKYMTARLDAIHEFSGLGDFFDYPVYTYSSGMNVRLGFSVALETDPDVLLIDEVLGVGDQVFAQKSSAALKEKFKGNRTVVLISHNASSIKDLCERAIWLERGQILAQGNPADVAKFYETNIHKYTR
ncbi:MAG: ABC transporter ATP-binding protein [Puniceicoccales bacterium]|jgi:lipopolysaccharide transport system ATP-binding protein|nr:ABC transporter ATP-binding protein [Puniceicoccales bacterium]